MLNEGMGAKKRGGEGTVELHICWDGQELSSPRKSSNNSTTTTHYHNSNKS